ncbi:hypothetical protein GYMLUDRAFT_286672 [Collybiopsis luxurians FD-317 M1]|nr:hypothetical protein GYMLUDRAFT_286672 [Collybiopsis luxurians FD-317 M1]
MESVLIEVCVDSVESAVNAARGGANRLELCGNLSIGGGTTPSLGLFKAVRKALEPYHIPIMVMIRPRIGDFLYSKAEIEVMLEDIQIFKEQGVQGFVFGVLTREGQVDVELLKILVSASSPKEVCFHRAFDMTSDANQAINDIMAIDGVTRILTSGQGKSVSDSLPVITSLLDTTRGSNLTVMPGSGINPSTIGRILDRLMSTNLTEIHLSAGGWVEGGMNFRREGMGMGVGGNGEWGIWRTDMEIVKQVKAQLQRASPSRVASLSC